MNTGAKRGALRCVAAMALGVALMGIGRGADARFPVVLMYHRVDVSAPADWTSEALTVSPKQFSDEMALLARSGVRSVGLEEYYESLRRSRPDDRVVLITFDDGYSDQYRYALPILEHYGFTATFFINTGTIGTPHHLTWDDLRAMRNAGMSIEAHGVDHVDLPALSLAEQAYQIDSSVVTLRRTLGVPVLGFAYPSGGFDAATMRLVQQSGVVFGFTTDSSRRWENSLYDLSRVRVKNGLPLDQFKSVIPSESSQRER